MLSNDKDDKYITNILQVIMGGTTTFVNVIYPVVKERNPEIVYIFNKSQLRCL